MKYLALVPLVALLFMGQSFDAAQGGRLGGPQGGRGAAPPRDPRDAQPAGTAVIRGRIIAADTSTPIRRAQVRATTAGGGGRGARLVTTDTDGRFELRDLPAGRWELSASKAGFVTLRYGQRRPFEAGRPIEIATGQKLDGMDIALPRGAAITGRVFDEFGDPIAGVRVQVLRYQLVQGERQLMPAANAGVSDDTGAFRVYGLMPGDYYVSALLRALDDPNDDSTYAPTYFPGTGSVAEAQRITIGLAQEQGNINFSLLPVRAVRITGTVSDSSGAPLAGGAVALLPADGVFRAPGLGGGGNRVGPDGRFTLANVPPGSYTLMATARPARGEDVEIASMSLYVGGEDMSGISLVTSKGTTLSGRIVAASGAGVPLPGSLQVAVAQVRPSRGLPSRPARAAADGTFTLTTLFGQGLIRVAGLPQDWALQSVVVGGVDVTDTPIEFRAGEDVRGAQITVTNRVTEISGTVSGGDGKPVRDYTVVVFPEDETKWTAPSRFIRSGRPDQQGLFRIRALPPNGRYLAVAVDYLEEGEANDPDFLAAAKNSGTRVALADGESKAVELKLLQR
jgi:protocatechuate 3,4-dioxygenase beta subunit